MLVRTFKLLPIRKYYSLRAPPNRIQIKHFSNLKAGTGTIEKTVEEPCNYYFSFAREISYLAIVIGLGFYGSRKVVNGEVELLEYCCDNDNDRDNEVVTKCIRIACVPLVFVGAYFWPIYLPGYILSKLITEFKNIFKKNKLKK